VARLAPILLALAVLIAGCATVPNETLEASSSANEEDAGAGRESSNDTASVALSAAPKAERSDDAPEDAEPPIAAMISNMTLSEKIGQLLMLSVPPGLGEGEGAAFEEFAGILEELGPGGVILFAYSIQRPDQIRSLIERMQNRSSIGLFVATDEEGGVVSRLSAGEEMNATDVPSAARVGRTRDPFFAYETGRIIGRELDALGFNMNFAPVADVYTNPKNTVVQSRAYGSDPDLVGEMVAAAVRGLQEVGISAVVKHFPGHGDTTGDSHFGEAVLEQSRDRLDAVELPPFARAIESGADAVMTGHIAVPFVTGSDVPATLSPELVEGLLRGDLGFGGVVISDSLAMAAVSNRFLPGEAAVRAIEAGVDILLMPADPTEAYEALTRAVGEGRLREARIDRSVARILELKNRRGILGSEREPRAAPESVLSHPSHRAIVEQIYELTR
jgi:beta-N-acetylhexosaminidase